MSQMTRRFQSSEMLLGWVLTRAAQIWDLWSAGNWSSCQAAWVEVDGTLDELAWRPDVLPGWADQLIGVGVPTELCEEFRAKTYRRHWRVATVG